MTIDELVREAHGTAIDKGWWVFPRTSLEIYALVHSEISEAVEAAREPGRENAQLEELADAVIRIADYCGHRQWDLDQAIAVKMAHNKRRAFRHGGKLV